MKIAIDKNVPVDENGNYLINVGYLRVSTDTQAEKGYGLDIQEEEIVNFAKYNKMENLLLFIDDGITGTTMNRPALNSIVKFIEDFNNEKSKIRINSMIIHRIDRLGRTLLGTLQFIQDYIVAAEDSKQMLWNKESWKDTNAEEIPIDKLEKKMTALNKEILEPKYGLSSAYQIGASYFLKYKNYKDKSNPLDSLWAYHLEGLLFEYLRGKPNAAELLKGLKDVYDKAE